MIRSFQMEVVLELLLDIQRIQTRLFVRLWKPDSKKERLRPDQLNYLMLRCTRPVDQNRIAR